MPVTQEASGDPNGATAALIITTDYESGSYATIDMADRSVHTDIASIHSDAVCRFDRKVDGIISLVLVEDE